MLPRDDWSLPREVEDAMMELVGWIESEYYCGEGQSELRAAILKFGDQRYEEGIEAGRELEQTKMGGS